MLNVALPKGRLGDKAYALFKKIGIEAPLLMEDTRKLFFESECGTARFFLIKPSDVAVYVERGIADIGIVGKDILEEDGADVYELLDLGIGKCKMCVCCENGYEDDASRTLVVATKYPNITRGFYSGVNRDIDIIKLNGSIELAPIMGMSNVIVDLVETGSTLRENNMKVDQEILNVTARLIACKSRYQFNRGLIDDIKDRLKANIID